MRNNFLQIKKLVIENVIWAERELRGRTGTEKKEIVIRKVLENLAAMLPWYIRWAKELIAPALIGRLVDLATRALNFMTGWDFSNVQLTEQQVLELACVLDAPLLIVADSCYGNDLGENIGELYHQYAISTAASNYNYNQLSPNLTRREIACRCGCGFDSITSVTVILFQAIRDFIKRPIVITSGCRCPEHNARVNGASSSEHMNGVALDMRVNGWSNRQFGEAVREAYGHIPAVWEHLRYFERVNSASGAVVHVDTGRLRSNVFRW